MQRITVAEKQPSSTVILNSLSSCQLRGRGLLWLILLIHLCLAAVALLAEPEVCAGSALAHTRDGLPSPLAAMDRVGWISVAKKLRPGSRVDVVLCTSPLRRIL